jgi:hypothetical protein
MHDGSEYMDNGWEQDYDTEVESTDVVDPGLTIDPTANFDPLVRDALDSAEGIGPLVDETIANLPEQTPTSGPFAGLEGGVPGGSGTEDVVGFINSGTTDVSDTINEFLDGDLTSRSDPASVPAQPWAPPLPNQPGLPEPSLPGPLDAFEPIIDPRQFTLNGFPYQGNDPTKLGYWNPPTT